MLSKLEWSHRSGSARQLEDVRAIVDVNRPVLDMQYLWAVAEELGVVHLLSAVLGTDPSGVPQSRTSPEGG
jgi:hypothetical protein